MVNNPGSHHRRLIRLQHYNYSLTGAYFISLCAYNKECLFGNIKDCAVLLNDFGNIVRTEWLNIPNHFPSIILDQFVIMPNHFHAIVIITDTVGAVHEPLL
mgnify:CR=1 FL=1